MLFWYKSGAVCRICHWTMEWVSSNRHNKGQGQARIRLGHHQPRQEGSSQPITNRVAGRCSTSTLRIRASWVSKKATSSTWSVRSMRTGSKASCPADLPDSSPSPTFKSSTLYPTKPHLRKLLLAKHATDNRNRFTEQCYLLDTTSWKTASCITVREFFCY